MSRVRRLLPFTRRCSFSLCVLGIRGALMYSTNPALSLGSAIKLENGRDGGLLCVPVSYLFLALLFRGPSAIRVGFHHRRRACLLLPSRGSRARRGTPSSMVHRFLPSARWTPIFCVPSGLALCGSPACSNLLELRGILKRLDLEPSSALSVERSHELVESMRGRRCSSRSPGGSCRMRVCARSLGAGRWCHRAQDPSWCPAVRP